MKSKDLEGVGIMGERRKQAKNERNGITQARNWCKPAKVDAGRSLYDIRYIYQEEGMGIIPDDVFVG